jgi:uncharacterized membrane protein
MTRKHLGLLLTFSLAINAAFIGAWAVRQLPEDEPAEPSNASVLWDDLELDPEAESTLRAHWDDLGDEASEISVQIDEDRRELFALLKQDEPDFEAIVETQQAIGEKQARLREMVILKMLETSRELDPEARRRWAGHLHEYAEERSHTKRWRRPGHHGRRRRADEGDLEDMLESGDATVRGVPVERGVEIQFRATDPEGAERLQREVRELIEHEFEKSRDRREHWQRSRDKHRRDRR